MLRRTDRSAETQSRFHRCSLLVAMTRRQQPLLSDLPPITRGGAGDPQHHSQGV